MSFAVEVTYPAHEHLRQCCPETFEFEAPEEAAQKFESEAEPSNYPLSQIVEDLATGEKVEHQNGRKLVVACELVEAVAR